MKSWFAAAAIAATVCWTQLAVSGHGGCPHCGCPDSCYEEVVTYTCRLVPDIKPIKKVVYSCKEVPFCEHRIPRLGHCDCCPECQACPKFKKVLVKREIVCGETCGTKCVVEETVHCVPKACCRCGCLPNVPPGTTAQQPAGSFYPAALSVPAVQVAE